MGNGIMSSKTPSRTHSSSKFRWDVPPLLTGLDGSLYLQLNMAELPDRRFDGGSTKQRAVGGSLKRILILL